MQNGYRFKTEQLEFMLKTNKDTGLSLPSYKKKRREEGDNRIYPGQDFSSRNYFNNIFVDFITVILLILCIVLWFTEKNGGAVFSAALIVINRIFSFAFYQSAKKTFNSLESYATPACRVVRDGKTVLQPQTKIVTGDVILLSCGDIVPADARIVSAEHLRVLEKNISGGDGEKQADFISYELSLPPEEQKNMIFAGSIVSRGEVRAIVCATGADTLLRRRSSKTRRVRDRMKLFDYMKRLSYTMSLFMTAAVFLLSMLYILTKNPGGLFPAFFCMAAAAAAAMSELYVMFGYLITAFALVSSLRRFKKSAQGALLKKMPALEKINELTCLVIPKTSGVCENRLMIEKIYSQGRETDVLSADFKTDRIYRLLCYSLALCPKINGFDKQERARLQAEDDAVMALASRCGITAPEIFSVLKPVAEKRTGGGVMFDTLLALRNDCEFVIISRGAPLPLIKRCTHFAKNGAECPLDEDGRQDLLSAALAYEKNSYRVSAVASKKSIYNHLNRENYIQSELCFEGFIVMREPVQHGVREAVEYCRRAEIKTLLFCDDMSGQNLYFAQDMGIIRHKNEVLYAYELDNSNINILNLKMKNYRLFLGLSPEQQKYVVSLLCAEGEKVGFIGHALEDAALLTDKSTVCFASDDRYAEKKQNPDAAADHQALIYASDAILAKAQKSGTGGYIAVAETVGLSKFVYSASCKLMKYLLISGAVRFLLTALMIFTPIETFSSSQLLFSGLMMDFFAVFAFLGEYHAGASNVVMKTGFAEIFKRPGKVILRLCCVCAALIFSFLACCALLFLTDASSGETTAALFLSMILLQTALLYEAMGGSDRKNIWNKAFALVCGLSLIFAVLAPVWFSGFGFGTLSVKALSALVSPVLFLLSAESVRLIRKKKKRRIL